MLSGDGELWAFFEGEGDDLCTVVCVRVCVSEYLETADAVVFRVEKLKKWQI